MKLLSLLLITLTTTAYCWRQPTSSDYFVTGLEDLGAKDELYSGYMPIEIKDNKEGNFFFTLAKQRDSPSKTRREKLVVWLNGGPGCSSMVGMMAENGPFSVQFKDGANVSTTSNPAELYKLVYNENSWNEVAHVLYLEQPLRTGYSVAAEGAKSIKDEREVAKDFYRFLNSFLTVFTELQGVPVYITGESFSGAYIPWMADHLLKEQNAIDWNSPDSAGLLKIDLKGIAIGNGYVDQIMQERSYAEYAYAHGIISSKTKTVIEEIYTECISEAGALNVTSLKRGVIDHCGIMNLVLEAAGQPNEYNVNTFRIYNALLSTDGPFNQFFNNPTIQSMLHVRGVNIPGINFNPESSEENVNKEHHGEYFYAPKQWRVCNDQVDEAFVKDHPITAVPALKYIANYTHVLLYNGEFDLNCNFLGTQRYLEKNEWNGRSWNSANRSLWRANLNIKEDLHSSSNSDADAGGEEFDVSGEYFSLGKLSFLIIRNSGHLVPMDLPVHSLDLIHRFVEEISFADTPLLSDIQQARAFKDRLSSPLLGSIETAPTGTLPRSDGNGDSTAIAAWNDPSSGARPTLLIVSLLVLLVGGVVGATMMRRRFGQSSTNGKVVSMLPLWEELTAKSVTANHCFTNKGRSPVDRNGYSSLPQQHQGDEPTDRQALPPRLVELQSYQNEVVSFKQQI